MSLLYLPDIVSDNECLGFDRTTIAKASGDSRNGKNILRRPALKNSIIERPLRHVREVDSKTELPVPKETGPCHVCKPDLKKIQMGLGKIEANIKKNQGDLDRTRKDVQEALELIQGAISRFLKMTTL